MNTSSGTGICVVVAVVVAVVVVINPGF
jgi:hypothetical protein